MISETGYWDKDTNINEHRHSVNVSNWIINFLNEHKETQIYDFGCGLGNYLLDFHKNGFKHLKGFEADPINTDLPFEIVKTDLSQPFVMDKRGIVISLEVGEHIPPKYQDIFLQNIKDNCDKYLILSWAIRGQGGYGHVNELDNYEIIPRIEDLGFKYMKELSDDLRKTPEHSCRYFRNTLMIFKKN